jgi:glutathione peroxidase
MRSQAAILMNSRSLLAALSSLFLVSCSGFFTKEVPRVEPSGDMTLHSLKVESLDSGTVDLAKYEGDVLLVVNVASECGFTRQYAGLESLEKELAPKGFHVLGFPSNEFGGQEPGAPEAIRKFCTEEFAVTFPLFAKVSTKAVPEQSPVYAYLGGATGKLPGWNFGKYLVGRDGKPIGFYDSRIAPDDATLRADIEKALAAR